MSTIDVDIEYVGKKIRQAVLVSSACRNEAREITPLSFKC